MTLLPEQFLRILNIVVYTVSVSEGLVKKFSDIFAGDYSQIVTVFFTGFDNHNG